MASLDDTETKVVTLTSKEGKEFPVGKKAVSISKLVTAALEDDKDGKVPLSLRSQILEMVIDYMVHHDGTMPNIVEKPLRSKAMKEVCQDQWDAEFIDRIGEDRKVLYELMLAANYMDISTLLHLGAAKVASLIKGQPLEKIKEILDTK